MRDITFAALAALTDDEVVAVTESWSAYAKTEAYYAARQRLFEAVGEQAFQSNIRFNDIRETTMLDLRRHEVGSAAAWADLATSYHGHISVDDLEILTRAWSVLPDPASQAVSHGPTSPIGTSTRSAPTTTRS